tara:strand:- start:191 stop:787 length:597 start_codon:yes stop_codon:yes gene_type:complete
MSADQETVNVYDKKISDYKKLISKELKDTNLDIFMNMIESGGKVLDLGCGTGSASLELSKRGFLPFPVDASLEMIKVAEALLKIKARKISFDEIDEHNFYHAIWANFSLLHITKNKFSDILKILFSALKEKGILFFSLKRGVGESRDKLGRFYSYYEKSEVEKYLEKATFQTKRYTEGVSVGLAGDIESWMGFFCEKI